MVLHIFLAQTLTGLQFGKNKNLTTLIIMARFIFFVIFIFSYQIASSQGNELIYKKIIPGISIELKPYRDGSGYAIEYKWVNQFNTPLIDVGIWTESIQNILIDDVYYDNGVIVYNSDFEPAGQMLHKWIEMSNFHPISIDRTILNFNKTSIASDWTQFPAIPPVTDYPSDLFGQSVFIQYNAEAETNVGLMNFSSPGVNSYFNAEPFKGFYNAGNENMNVLYSTKPTVILGDSLLISYLGLYDTQTLNETSEYSNLGGQLNLVRAQLNLESNELTSQQIGSALGSQVTLVVAPTMNMQGVLRTGLVRGNNTPISVSGAQVDMMPNDSLYHVFITKETATGNTEWLTELYAYNNTAPDTLINNSGQFNIRNGISNIIEKDDAIYVSSKFTSVSKINDTLMYRDFLGQNYLYSEIIPYYGSFPDTYQNPFADVKVYKLDANGGIIGKLSYVYEQWGYEISGSGIPYDHLHKNQIFEVADKLAWVHRYYSQNDTTAKFTYTSADGSEQNTYLDFPAGQGVFILWLDDNLTILDNWLIPFQNSEFGGMSINSVLPYNGDTLLIQGSIMPNTSTDFNPFGDSEISTTDTWSSFFAFYSAPEILTSAKTAKKPNSFSVYPNPATQTLSVSGLKAIHDYCIYDLSGRALYNGSVSQNEQIHVSNLTSGMYILQIDIDGSGSTEKFVVE